MRDFWDARASLGLAAGTGDAIASELERRVILSHGADGLRVLDVGCGTGTTLAAMAAAYRIDAVGVDFSEAMIAQARQVAPALAWHVGALPDLPDLGQFDLVYTQRCLINLPDAATQRLALHALLACVRPGGKYVMVENTMDGLATINALRDTLRLPPVEPPWHNRYLREAEIAEWQRELGYPVRASVAVASLYSFLSRVLNARLAADQGREPEYTDPLNLLALEIPNVGDSQLGQNRVWVWRVDG